MEAQDKPDIAIPQTETKPLVKTFNGEGKNVVLGITGTSGAIYGLRMLRALIMSDFNVDLILTEFAHYTLFKECGVELKPGNVQNIFPEIMMRKSTVSFLNNLDLKSEIFMNWYSAFGMIVSPCSMDYIAGIANGEGKNLIEKTADWTLSYSKPLIVVPRETPINRIHIRNMGKIMEAGGKVVPAMPGFEYNPKDFNDLADFIAGKVVNLLMQSGSTV
jgi:flavin prenyltransferase